MTADRFESRVADWLEDGPDIAPDELAEAALRHAAVHPRSRLRSLERRTARFAPILAAAGIVVAVSGVALVGASRFRLFTTATSPVAVAGTETCTNKVIGAHLSPQAGSGDADELRGRIDICQETASDPRASGELTRTVDGWLYEPIASSPAGDSMVFGSMELRNGQGAWTGNLVGTYKTETGMADGRLTWMARGSGAYEGLAYRATVVTDAAGHGTVTGTIEWVGRDAVIATTWCWVTTMDPDWDASEPVVHREASRDCVVTGADGRLAGSASEHRIIDVAADGSTTDSGTMTVTTATGGWSGSFAGTGNWGVPGAVTGTLEGSGALEGLSLAFRIVSEDGMHGVVLGTISSAP
jgi:hypothetical protein